MPGYTDYGARKILDHAAGKAAWTMPTISLGLFTTMPDDAGAGGVEVSGGSYARVTTSAASWNAAAGSAPASITTAADLSFPNSTAAWGDIVGVGQFDASSGGNLIRADYLGLYDWKPFTCSNASPGVLTVPAHGYTSGQLAIVSAEFGGTLPTTGGTWAGTKTITVIDSNTFSLGVNTTGIGNGMVRRVLVQTVPDNNTIRFAAGQLQIRLA